MYEDPIGDICQRIMIVTYCLLMMVALSVYYVYESAKCKLVFIKLAILSMYNEVYYFLLRKGTHIYIEVHYPINGFANAHEVIEAAQKTGIPIADLIGRGLPADWSQDQLIAAHLRGECSEAYLARRFKVDNLQIKRIVQERLP